jgi:hypothetical protein
MEDSAIVIAAIPIMDGRRRREAMVMVALVSIGICLVVAFCMLFLLFLLVAAYVCRVPRARGDQQDLAGTRKMAGRGKKNGGMEEGG